MSERVEGGDLWCILRTAGARTLPLARSLVGAGFDAWTPVQASQRRRGRNRVRVEVEAPIMPTFVFVRAHHLDRLIEVLALPINPHPPFSIFRHLDRIPLVADADIVGLRQEEGRAALARLRKQRHSFAPGQNVHVPEGGFAGMTGVVETGDGKYAMVNFGGGFRVKVASFLLRSNDVAIARSAAA